MKFSLGLAKLFRRERIRERAEGTIVFDRALGATPFELDRLDLLLEPLQQNLFLLVELADRFSAKTRFHFSVLDFHPAAGFSGTRPASPTTTIQDDGPLFEEGFRQERL